MIIILFFIVAVVSLAFYARDTQDKVKKTLFAMQTNYEISVLGCLIYKMRNIIG